MPQTALTVLAEEPSKEAPVQDGVTNPAGDGTGGGVDIDPGDNGDDNDDTPDNPGNSEDIPITNNGQKQEDSDPLEENKEKISDDLEQSKGEITPSDLAPATDPAPEEDPAPEADPEDDVEEPETEINADDPTAVTVTVEAAEGEDQSSSYFDIEYLHGCVSNGTLEDGADLEFYVHQLEGRKVTKVEQKIGDAASYSDVTKTGTIYKIQNSVLVTTASDGKKTYKPVSIRVTTAPMVYTVKFAAKSGGAAETTGYSLYTVAGSTGALEGTALTGSTGVEIKAGDDDKKIGIEVKDSYKLVDASMGGETLVSADDTAQDVTASGAKKMYLFDISAEDVIAAAGELADSETAKTYTVTVNVRADHTLYVKGLPAAGTGYAVAASAEAGALDYSASNNGFGVSDGAALAIAEGDDNLDKSLAFKVTPEDNYKINAVYAEYGEADGTTGAIEDGAEKTRIDAVEKAATAPAKIYTIPLSGIEVTGNLGLVITVDVSLDTDAAEKVRTVSFVGTDTNTLKHIEKIEYKEDSAAAYTTLAEGKTSLTTAAKVLKVKITPEDGYEFTKGTKTDEAAQKEWLQLPEKQVVTVTETRKYDKDDTVDGYETEATYKHEEISYDPEQGSAEDKPQDITINLAQNGGSDTGDGCYEYPANATEKKYYDTAVSVSVGLVPVKNEQDTTVEFVDELGDLAGAKSYDFPNKTGINPDDTMNASNDDTKKQKANTWAIDEDLQTLAFTVTSDYEPEVTLSVDTGSNYDITIKPVSAAEKVYTYEVPTNQLTGTFTVGNEAVNKIKIAKKATAKNVKVVIPTESVSFDMDTTFSANAGFKYQINSGSVIDGPSAGAEADGKTPYTIPGTNVGDKVKLVFKTKTGATFEKVATAGENGKEATYNKAKTEATLEFVVAGDTEVSVTTKSDYEVAVVSTAHPAPEGVTPVDGVFNIDYKDSSIVLNLKRVGTDDVTELYNVIVKKGGATAATKAAMTTTTATIASIDKKDYGSTLEVELYRARGGRPYTALLKVNSPAESVTITNLSTQSVMKEGESVDVMADSKISFKVDAVEGMRFDDLAVEVRSATGTTTADDEKARALIQNGSTISLNAQGVVTVQTKPADDYAGEVLLCVYNKNAKTDKGAADKTALKGGTIVLNITEPLVYTDKIKDLKISKTVEQNTKVSGAVNAVLANPKNAVPAPVTGGLYYKVEVTGINKGEVMDGGTVETADPKTLTKYYEIAKTDGTYSGSLAAPFTVDSFIKEYVKADKNKTKLTNPAEGSVPCSIGLDVKVTLIQTTKAGRPDSLTEKDMLTSWENGAYFETKLPVYESKLTVKAVNGGTVYTGQTDAGYNTNNMTKVATPVFSKETSYVNNITLQFVDTKTGVDHTVTPANEITTTVSGVTFKAAVGTDGAVYVGAGNANLNSMPDTSWKTLGVKIIASAPAGGYKASGVAKIALKQGIQTVAADESKATLPTEIFVDGKGNAKAVKITALLNSGIMKPAKNTLEWSITDPTGKKAGEDGCTLTPAMISAISGSKPQISVKNGSISIKGYKFDTTGNEHANEFGVTFRAADYATNGQTVSTKKTVKFTITKENQTIGSLVVVKEKPANTLKVVSATLTADDFRDGNIYITALDGKKDAKAEGSVVAAADTIPVTLKGKGSVTLGSATTVNSVPNLIPVTFVKAGKTKITANTVDGGKAGKVKDTIELNVTGFTNLGLQFVSGDQTDTIAPDVAEKDGITYSGSSNQQYKLYLQHKVGTSAWAAETDYTNVKVSVKGGKFIEATNWKKTGGTYLGYIVVASGKDGVATVTLTDNGAGKKLTHNYTIKNKNVSNAKAPGIKIYKQYNTDGEQKKIDNSTNEIVWKVTDTKEKKYAGSYVMIAPDYTVKQDPKKLDAQDVAGSVTKIKKIDENNLFSLSGLNFSGYENGGSIKLIATVGDMKDGEFVACAKDVKLSFTVPKKKVDRGLKVATGYTLDPLGAAEAKIEVKTDEDYTIEGPFNIVKKNVTKDSWTAEYANHFTDYFEIRRDENISSKLCNETKNYAYIGIKSNIQADALQKLMTDKDVQKNDCVGYITVDNGSIRKDFQIKISVKGVKITAAPIEIYEETSKSIDVPVTFYNGKQKIDIAADDALMAIDTAEANDFADSVKKSANSDGTVIIKTKTNSLTPGKKTVTLKLVTADVYERAYTDAKGAAIGKADLLKDYAVSVPVTVNVKVLDGKNVINVGKNTSYNVSKRAYVKPAASVPDVYDRSQSNGYLRDASTNNVGEYIIDVPYVFNGDSSNNVKVDNKKENFSVDLKDGSATIDKKTVDLITVDTVTRNYLGSDGVTAYTQDVLRLHVNKAVLAEMSNQAAADKKAKVAATWGKKVQVPVNVTVQNASGTKATQTIKFSLTMPSKALTFAEVQARVNDPANGVAAIQPGTNMSARGTNAIITDLKDKVGSKVRSLVDADTDVTVGAVSEKAVWGIDDPDGTVYDGTKLNPIMSKGQVRIEVALTNNADSNAATNHAEPEWTYALDVTNKRNDSDDDDVAILTAIKADLVATGSNNLQEKVKVLLNNSITAAGLERLLKETKYTPAAGGEKTLVERYDLNNGKKNISIRVIDFKIVTPITANAGGSVEATVLIKDLLTGESETTDTITLTTGKQGNIADAKAALGDEDSSTDGELAASVEQIYKDARGDKELVRAAIIAKANELIKNPAINVSIEESTFVCTKPIKANSSVTPNIAKQNGVLTFVLLLKENGRVMKWKLDVSKKVSVDPDSAADIDKYISADDAGAKEIRKVFFGGDGSTVNAQLTETAALNAVKAAIGNDENTVVSKSADETAIKEAIKTKVDAKLKGASPELYGFDWDYSDFTYEKATSTQDGTLAFTLLVYPIGKREAASSVIVETTKVADKTKATKNMTAAELTAKVDGLENLVVATIPATADAAKTAVTAEIANWNLNSQSGELKGITDDDIDMSKATFTAAVADTTPATLAGVKVTVRRNEGGKYRTFVDKTLTVTFAQKVQTLTTITLDKSSLTLNAATQDATGTVTATLKDQDGMIISGTSNYTFKWMFVGDDGNETTTPTGGSLTNEATATVTVKATNSELTEDGGDLTWKVKLEVKKTSNETEKATSGVVTVTVNQPTS